MSETVGGALVCGIMVLILAVIFGGAALAARRETSRCRRDLLLGRADQQHAWVIAGDDRGIYGDAHTAWATRYVLSWPGPAPDEKEPWRPRFAMESIRG